MKKIRGFLLLFAISILLTACQGGLGLEQYPLQQYNQNSNNMQYKADYDILDKGPVKGGVLNLFTTAPDNFNPLLTKNRYISEFLSFVYEGLTRLDEKQQALPLLSDSWSVSADGLVWNFHIRDDVQWQDGQPFTSADVEFTVKTLLNPGIDSIYKPLLLNIVSFAAVDTSNIKLVLGKPNSFMPEMMTFPIMPKHQFKQKDVLTASKNFQPIGTGSYKFEAYTENKKAVLRSNKNWWFLNSEGNDIKDSMYIETIQVNIFNHPDEAMGAFQTGEIDAVGIEASDLVKYKGRTDLMIKKYTSRDFEFLAFNLNNPIMADNYARKAIALAIDRDKIIKDILPGEAVAADLPVLPESWISDNISQAKTQTKDDPLTTSNAIIAKTSREVLLQGGWKESNQGYYKMIGSVRKYLKVEIIVNSNNSLRVQVAQKICSQLEQAGITAICTQVVWNDLLSRLSTGNYEIALIGCTIPQIPDISYLYSHGYLPTALPAKLENAHNVSGYFNMQLDSILSAMFRENNAERKKELFQAAKEQAFIDTPYLGLYFLRNAMVYSKNIRGPLKPDTWNVFKDMTHWYKPELQ